VNCTAKEQGIVQDRVPLGNTLGVHATIYTARVTGICQYYRHYGRLLTQPGKEHRIFINIIDTMDGCYNPTRLTERIDKV